MGIKIKISAKFLTSRRRRFQGKKKIMSSEMRAKRFGGLFLKRHETFLAYLGATIPFISSQRQGSKPSNFGILLVFLTVKTY